MKKLNFIYKILTINLCISLKVLYAISPFLKQSSGFTQNVLSEYTEPPLRERKFVLLTSEELPSFLSALNHSPCFNKLNTLSLIHLKKIDWIFQVQAPHLENLLLCGLSFPTWNLLRIPLTRKLRVLALSGASAKSDRTDKHIPVYLPCLEKLVLRDFYLKDFTELSGWNTPNLKILWLSSSNGTELDSFQGVSAFNPKLETLAIEGMTIKSFKGLTHIPLPHLSVIILSVHSLMWL